MGIPFVRIVSICHISLRTVNALPFPSKLVNKPDFHVFLCISISYVAVALMAQW